MLSDQLRQDMIASNLANVNTAGYKRDRAVNESFHELFLSNIKNGREVGGMSLGTRVAEVVTDYSQAPLRNTGSLLDVALAGEGFLVVQTPEGRRYTRDGQMQRAADGTLVNPRGNPILAADGSTIRISGSDPRITPEGRVYDGNRFAGQLAVVTLDVPKAIKTGENGWNGTVTGQNPAGTVVRQGFVEASGVNAVTEMVEMIRTLRSYESSQRAIMAIDGTLEKATTSVGQV